MEASSALPLWCRLTTWRRHQMEIFTALLAICAGNSPVTGEFPAQRPVTRSFDLFFDLRLNKRLNKQSWGWWFETQSSPLWRNCNDIGTPINKIRRSHDNGNPCNKWRRSLYWNRDLNILDLIPHFSSYFTPIRHVLPAAVNQILTQGPYSLRIHRPIGIRIPIINPRRSSDRLSIKMWIPIRRHLFGE